MVPDKKFKNKISRVIIACDDGGSRSEKAAELVREQVAVGEVAAAAVSLLQRLTPPLFR